MRLRLVHRSVEVQGLCLETGLLFVQWRSKPGTSLTEENGSCGSGEGPGLYQESTPSAHGLLSSFLCPEVNQILQWSRYFS